MSDPNTKRPAPFCIRLSADERAELERDAGGMALGAYIKSRLFERRNRAAGALAARMLARLGGLGLLNFLDALHRANQSGLAAIPSDLEASLLRLRTGISTLRDELLAALGSRGAP